MPQSIQLSVSDHGDIGALQARLQEVPGAEITRTAGLHLVSRAPSTY